MACWLVLNHNTVSTHSRPKAAGETENFVMFGNLFQHTAARRRLDFRKL